MNMSCTALSRGLASCGFLNLEELLMHVGSPMAAWHQRLAKACHFCKPVSSCRVDLLPSSTLLVKLDNAHASAKLFSSKRAGKCMMHQYRSCDFHMQNT